MDFTPRPISFNIQTRNAHDRVFLRKQGLHKHKGGQFYNIINGSQCSEQKTSNCVTKYTQNFSPYLWTALPRRRLTKKQWFQIPECIKLSSKTQYQTQCTCRFTLIKELEWRWLWIACYIHGPELMKLNFYRFGNLFACQISTRYLNPQLR